MKKSKKEISITELTKGYESFAAKNQQNADGKYLFEKVLKKAATTKQRGSKPSQT